jgi:uncharacterized protein (DUF2141 family)
MISFHADHAVWSGMSCRALKAAAKTAMQRRRSRRWMGQHAVLALTALGALSVGMQSATAAALQINVTGVRSAKGQVNLCVFDTEQGFPDCGNNAAVTSRRQAAVPDHMRFDVDVAPGVHAVTVQHDENDNGKLDTNFLGIPREGVGASNHPASRLGPPKFADSAFQLLPEGGRIEVRMVYP